ncbi:MAG: hypothetical protein WCO07_02810 [bacterium]
MKKMKFLAEIQLGGFKTVEELSKSLEKIKMDRIVTSFIPKVTICESQEKIYLFTVSATSLGFVDDFVKYKDIYTEAKKLGLGECSLKTSFLFHLQHNQQKGETMIIPTDMHAGDECSRALNVMCDENGKSIKNELINTYRYYSSSQLFIFCKDDPLDPT